MNDFGLRIFFGEKTNPNDGIWLWGHQFFLSSCYRGNMSPHVFMLESEWLSFPPLQVGEASQIRHA